MYSPRAMHATLLDSTFVPNEPELIPIEILQDMPIRSRTGNTKDEPKGMTYRGRDG